MRSLNSRQRAEGEKSMASPIVGSNANERTRSSTIDEMNIYYAMA
ncbi:hypothetical protein BMAPRL20_0231 [Burkholderia mallei PRL-20]|uniref:Uncharacterized protein n=1 Tax=Burkholderia mallei (strain NCTC 10229) TaxID=412022 RepID=A2S0F1_BURM9|nr:hypothetical protein BMA10229_1620 [Burkholderia mallei NCTC 10229]EDK58083.1 hypothetical protein BMAJHU_E0207 [Burkholderia mallei JHU]EDU12386.1 hypothetical protein BURPS1655_D1280 [Burkholderia pseudomallei 1655]EEP87843.1 conserved hypothetical protein [Burkholderia mallei GB8 horse 4]EES44161.1 hypothetical protein BMAPRL20_0231 [Burkholderia mallei PRL-20]